jgi:hypothetical protein
VSEALLTVGRRLGVLRQAAYSAGAALAFTEFSIDTMLSTFGFREHVVGTGGGALSTRAVYTAPRAAKEPTLPWLPRTV